MEHPPSKLLNIIPKVKLNVPKYYIQFLLIAYYFLLCRAILPDPFDVGTSQRTKIISATALQPKKGTKHLRVIRQIMASN